MARVDAAQKSVPTHTFCADVIACGISTNHFAMKNYYYLNSSYSRHVAARTPSWRLGEFGETDCIFNGEWCS